MSKIKNGGLDQYGAEPFERQQFGTSGAGRVKRGLTVIARHEDKARRSMQTEGWCLYPE